MRSMRQELIDRMVYLVLDMNHGDDKGPETIYCLQKDISSVLLPPPMYNVSIL